MDKIQELPMQLVYLNKVYEKKVYLTAWDRLCISYRRSDNDLDNLFSVVIEEENEPTKIKDTLNFLINRGIGNERDEDSAVESLKEFIKFLDNLDESELESIINLLEYTNS